VNGELLSLGWPLALVLVAFVVAAATVTGVAGLGPWLAPVTAAVRCVVQLGAVSLVIGLALGSMVWTSVFVVGMVVVAAGTAARRVTGVLQSRGMWMVLPIAAGVVPTLGLGLVSSVIPAEPVAVLPSAGILIGGAMTATTLAGRRLVEELDSQHGAFEAALSLGFTRRQSVGVVARGAAALALVPGQDQARTVGLVTLPGAFVGVLLAGGSAVEAGAAQAFILIALLAVQALAVAVIVELIAAALLLPASLTLAP